MENSAILTVNLLVDSLSGGDKGSTDSLGFFFGPGLPLGFTGSSTPVPSSRFDPVLGLADSFLTDSAGGVGSAFVIVGGERGVPLEADLDSGSCGGGGGVGSLGGAGVLIDKGDFFLGADFWVVLSCGNRSSAGLGN